MGKLSTKNNLYLLLTYVTFIGKINYKDEVPHGGEETIVPDKMFQRSQKLLRKGTRSAERFATSTASYCVACFVAALADGDVRTRPRLYCITATAAASIPAVPIRLCCDSTTSLAA